MTEMIERVARALAWEDGSRWEKLIVPDETSPYERRARAAIEAMREATEGMVEEVIFSSEYVGGDGEGGCWIHADGARGAWRAMIDEALK